MERHLSLLQQKPSIRYCKVYYRSSHIVLRQTPLVYTAIKKGMTQVKSTRKSVSHTMDLVGRHRRYKNNVAKSLDDGAALDSVFSK